MTYKKQPELIVGGFPKALSADALQLARSMSNVEVFDEYMHAHIDGEELSIPQRIYFKDDERNVSQNILLLCALSRSTDGYVREAALKKILSDVVPDWAISYVFVALGDYVFQVNETVLGANRDTKIALRRFVKNNYELVQLVESRIISYWNEYHKADFATYRDYPPYQFLNELLNAQA